MAGLGWAVFGLRLNISRTSALNFSLANLLLVLVDVVALFRPAGVRVGMIDGQMIFNPTYEQRLASPMDVTVVGTAEKILMLEAGCSESTESEIEAAVRAGMQAYAPVLDLIKEMQKELGVNKVFALSDGKFKLSETEQASYDLARVWLSENINKILFDKTYYTKKERKLSVRAIKDGLKEYLTAQGAAALPNYVKERLVESMVEAEVTKAIINDKRRVDGRTLNEIRQLNAEVGFLPRVHGSGLFSRGETQVMSIVTLGPSGDKQSLEGVEGRSEKNYMHHYYFPGFSVGEAKGSRGVGNREIGHGALAEKALMPVLPAKADFPYTVRVVSETLSSNGSSSMASTCGSTLALMDAGVPIKKPVAGIAMGLASNADLSKWEVLTDLQDLEDGAGGMDFKIAGTADGVTAIQLDTKTEGLTMEIVSKTLTQGKEARMQILEVMKGGIAEVRAELSPWAPRIVSFYINPERIREVIGTGGKVINEIIAACEVSIDIEDDGLVMICGVDSEKTQKAVDWVKSIVHEFKAGEIFTGKVVRMLDFGAFVSLVGGKDGMVHVSEMAPYRVASPDKLLAIGDSVTVRVKEVDEQGRINLSMKGQSENEALWKDEKGKQEPGAMPNRNGDRPERGGARGSRFAKR
jgi:polyribonucleotide nucleotidyltransferase